MHGIAGHTLGVGRESRDAGLETYVCDGLAEMKVSTFEHRHLARALRGWPLESFALGRLITMRGISLSMMLHVMLVQWYVYYRTRESTRRR